MTPYHSDDLVTLLHGDVVETLRQMEPQSVHCVITSPPYWKKRNYHIEGQLGAEATIEEFVAKLVAVFAEVKRILRDDGLLFLNLGDKRPGSGVHAANHANPGLSRAKALDIANIPHRVAQALQADGWYWRDTWHWIKRSPMPESVSGTRWERHRVKVGKTPKQGEKWSGDGEVLHEAFTRPENLAQYQPCPGCAACTYPDQPQRNGWVLRRGSWRYTSAVEYVFMFAKQPGYTAFQEQVREASGWQTGLAADFARDTKEELSPGQRATSHRNGREPTTNTGGRTPRNYGLLSSEPSSEPHYATFSQALVEPFIRAATSDRGVCATCGAQMVPVIEKGALQEDPQRQGRTVRNVGDYDGEDYAENGGTLGLVMVSAILDYWPSCACPVLAQVPATVLDIFVGSGTTCIAARRLGRRSIGIDLSLDYLDIAKRRLADEKNAQAEMM